MKWASLFGPKAVLEAENERLRRALAEREARVAQLSAALDDALDREQMHSLSASHERLTPAAWIDRVGQSRAQHPVPAPAQVEPRGAVTQPGIGRWMRDLESTAASVSVDRRRSR